LGTQSVAREKRPVILLKEYFTERKLSTGFEIKAEVAPGRFTEQAYFTLHLDREGDSSDPVFAGLYSSGRPSQFIAGWVDGDYFDTTSFKDGGRLVLSEIGLDGELFRLIGGLIPTGGSLMVSYSLFSKESRIHKETKQGLDRNYPPVVTPLGFLLFLAGCGMGFKDWYFAEGGREGPEKLQGFKSPDQHAAKTSKIKMLQELNLFLAHSRYEDNLEVESRARAEIVVRELESNIELG
jgi:hypothetical protein